MVDFNTQGLSFDAQKGPSDLFFFYSVLNVHKKATSATTS